jgi:hypothetical protein
LLEVGTIGMRLGCHRVGTVQHDSVLHFEYPFACQIIWITCQNSNVNIRKWNITLYQSCLNMFVFVSVSFNCVMLYKGDICFQ